MRYEYLLISPSGETFLGETLREAVEETGWVQIDERFRLVVYKGQDDQIKFARDMHLANFYDCAVNRAASLLKRDGWAVNGLHEILG